MLVVIGTIVHNRYQALWYDHGVDDHLLHFQWIGVPSNGESGLVGMELSTVIMEKTSFPHADNSNGSGVGGVSVSVFRESRENGMSSSASSVWESVLGSFSPSLS